MATPRIPPPLESIRVPEFFSPSRFVDIEQCPLAVFGENVARDVSLPLSASALFGTLLHHVREQLVVGNWGDATDAPEAIELVLDRAATDFDRVLRETPGLAGLAPLRRAVGRVRWNTRLHEIRVWGQALKQRSTGAAPTRPTLDIEPRDSGAPDDHIDFGAEARVTCSALRLSGRADRIDRRPDGSVEVVEYKTGNIVDARGRVRARHARQVRLYALCVEALEPGVRVRPFVERAQRYAVAWENKDRTRCLENLDALRGRFPAGETRDAAELARPGAACSLCRLRNVCGAYQAAAPGWWAEASSVTWALPLDLFGTVVRRRESELGIDFDLRDGADRSVRVEGLDPERDLDDVRVGEELLLFDLEPTEPTSLHGVRVHPRNFHEFPPDGGRSMRRARSLQIYRA